MKSRRLQKFILSFGIILSLAASSLAACVCSHHAIAKAQEHATSCHQISHKTEQNQAENAETKSNFPEIGESCNCFAKVSQPFIVGKSENVKTQKTLAILPVQTKAETLELVSKNDSAKIHFEYHFYNSNYLRKLTPPRAPPVL